MIRTALFSLYDTSNVAEYARTLVSLGWQVMGSRETSSILLQEGIPCTDITEFTGIQRDFGIPPTLHPKIENALTMESPEERIDLVYDIPYPLSVGNDVGGRVLLALAAKGRRIPVMSQADMQRVLAELQAEGDITDGLRAELIDKANAEIASHYLMLVQKSERGAFDGLVGRQVYPLANGENPYQVAELFAAGKDDPLALHRFVNLSETAPCFTNLADVDALLNTLHLVDAAFQENLGRRPYLALASKHGNVCGASYDWSEPYEAIERALFGNPLAVWGGELAVNFTVDETIAEVMVQNPRREELLGSAAWMLDVVIAPGYTPAASNRLLMRAFRKVFQNPALHDPQPLLEGNSYRPVRGGFLRQSPPWRVLRFSEMESASPLPEGEDAADMILAWAAAYTSFLGGNEIALAQGSMLVGVGGGPATVMAAKTAVERSRLAHGDISGSVFCADAFFPFTDGPEVLIEAGVRLGCVPAGGRNESLVREAFEKAGVRLYYLPEDFRGFCRH